ncbi:MAG: O-methyltransferase [Bacteroidetes bacterium]|nr:MAG: O-methyltransferase [Bacteroidota bacterium]
MNFLHPDIENYAQLHSSPESEILQKLNRETHARILRPRMLSGHMQGKLLEMISCMLQPERILEIGTYTGYSAICMARGLKKNGKLITIDHNPELEEFTRSFFKEAGLSDKIEYLIGEAVDILPTLNGPFDLAFIDADKENYTFYYEHVLEKLKPGGVILADNVLWSGKVLSEDAANGDPEANALIHFNKFVQNDQRAENLMLPFRDGLTIIRKL